MALFCDNWSVGWVAVTQVLGRMILTPKWQRCFKRSDTAGPTISFVAVNSCSNMGDCINQWWVGRSIYVFECFCIAIPTSNGQLAVDVEPRTVQLALVAPSRATWRMMVKAQVGSAGLQPNHDRDFGAGGWDSRIPNHCGPKNIRYIRIQLLVYYICSHTRVCARVLFYM